ncbi:MAG TPA: hypothetical protein PJ986_10615 [Gammaproteobacteria bacterium]|nr:hypothetical protein [Gammaproteobacteria bacterium]
MAARNKGLNAFLKAKGREAKAKISHIRIYKEVYKSRAFRTLPPVAMKLLLLIWSQHNGKNNGSLIASFSLLREDGFTNERVLAGALRTLVERGFLEVTRPAVRGKNGTSARYAITLAPIDEPQNDVPHNAVPTKEASHAWRVWERDHAGGSAGKTPRVEIKIPLADLPAKTLRIRQLKGQNSPDPAGGSASHGPVSPPLRLADPPEVFRSATGVRHSRGAVAVSCNSGIAVREVVS